LQVYRLLGEAACGNGDLDLALKWEKELDAVVERFSKNNDELPALQKGELLRFKGMLAIQMREWEKANDYLQQSLIVFRKLRSRLHIGRTLYQIGILAATRNSEQVAAEYFGEAGGIFEEIGARLDAQLAEAALLDIKNPDI
jgi:tetratricopeptide (TPR) repeat protein